MARMNQVSWTTWATSEVTRGAPSNGFGFPSMESSEEPRCVKLSVSIVSDVDGEAGPTPTDVHAAARIEYDVPGTNPPIITDVGVAGSVMLARYVAESFRYT